MKRKLIMAASVLMAVALVGCGEAASSGTKVIEREAGSEASSRDNGVDNGTAAADAGYVFTTNGVSISVDSDFAPILEALGESDTYFESPSCAADGIGKLYGYGSFEVETYPDGDIDRVLYVRLMTDSVSTAEGIDLSSSKDDIKAAYGEPADESGSALTYNLGDMSLTFLFDGEDMISIEYDSPKA